MIDRSQTRRAGVTLVELLVVVAIVGVLAGLLLPAVQAARESARRSSCTNNVRQLAIGVHTYADARSHFPPSMLHTPGTTFVSNNGSWSIHGRLLPYLEESTIAARINLEQAWDDGFTTGTPDPTRNWAHVRTARIGAFLCPSERQPMARTKSGVAFVQPHTYGFNLGTWFVYDPRTGAGGDGAFHPNSNFTAGRFTDGLSRTLCLAEVKAFTPYVRNSSDPSGSFPADAPPQAPGTIAGLCTGAAAADVKLGPATNDCTGHTEWPDGRVHHSGITTVFVPNTRVPYPDAASGGYDIDYNSRQEGSSASARTFAAITSRSYHPGLVVTAMMDGSVGTIADAIEPAVWRALGTRAGGETSGQP